MKRYGNLWPQIISFANLLLAAEKACKGKRFRPAVAAFHFDLEGALWQLHDELVTKTYRPGPYRSFILYESKPRQISAAPYRDRVVHHAFNLVPKLCLGTHSRKLRFVSAEPAVTSTYSCISLLFAISVE
jgi:hypothetical protein